MIRHAYLNSPQFDKVFPLVEHILMNSEKNLATYVGNSIQKVLDYLNISTKISYSSTIKNNQLSGQDRILDICKRQAADKYINPVGGRDLYSKEQFTKNGIELSFLKRKIVEYNQGEAEFYKDLSIIDILMYNDKSRISSILKEFELL